MSKILTGGRSVISIDNVVVGLFESCNFGANLTVESNHILGKYACAEITPVSYESVQIRCTGFRVVGQGVHVLPKFPKLQDILNLGPVTISMRDRKTGELVMTAIGCVGTAWNSGPNARQTTRIDISYTGISISDESGDQAEAGATSLP